MQLIPIDQRSRYQCYFCGETRSVKYFVKLPVPLRRSFDVSVETVSCCNRCAVIHSDKIDFNFKGGNQE